MSNMDQRLKALGAGAAVDVSKIATPATGGGAVNDPARNRSTAADVRQRREAGF